MEKLKKSQSVKLLPIAALLMITPLLSTSLRFKYLYFIVNILIIAVGAEAGLLSLFLQSQNHNKIPPLIIPQNDHVVISSVEEEKVSPECSTSHGVEPVKSPPNEFGGGESSHREDDEREELYQKAEIFIGNFYKQLKMQRQESWKKLHHISQN
ncbi:hypothetical protein ACS0TY_016924 [Phlomoides rotata]